MTTPFEPSASVSDAVASRRSIRKFLPDPVSREVLERVLEKAQRSPSGGNLQPWNATVLAGAALQRLIDSVAEVIPEGKAAYSPEYHVYPPELGEPYETRRFGVGEGMYAALEIARDDRRGRAMQFADNFRAFGAPVLLLVHTPRYMGPPQWADMGMWLQTVMLLLREEGLDTCAQEAWAVYQRQVRAAANIPDDHIFWTGLSIGYRDGSAPINGWAVQRAPIGEVVTFEGI